MVVISSSAFAEIILLKTLDSNVEDTCSCDIRNCIQNTRFIPFHVPSMYAYRYELFCRVLGLCDCFHGKFMHRPQDVSPKRDEWNLMNFFFRKIEKPRHGYRRLNCWVSDSSSPTAVYSRSEVTTSMQEAIRTARTIDSDEEQAVTRRPIHSYKLATRNRFFKTFIFIHFKVFNSKTYWDA